MSEALTIFGLVEHGVGIEAVSSDLCGPLISEGSLVRALPEWSLPPMDASLVFPEPA